jgi:LmbE family N-acetylglucosaminyl deacetylase
MMLHDPTAPVVVCSPHFDDAVLDCWTVLTRPGACEVINVFCGAPLEGYATWWDQLAGAKSSRQMHYDRLKEDRAALALANRTSHIAGLLDGQYRIRASPLLHALMVRIPSLRWRLQDIPLLRRLVVTSPPPTVQDIIAAMTLCVPAASIVCVPAAIGRHPDHVLLRDAALELARRGMAVRLYADLPYCLKHGWPSWISGGLPANEGTVDPLWHEDLSGVIESIELVRAATVDRLTPQQRVAKRAAVRCYRSQLSIKGSGLPELLHNDDSFDYEVYWQVNFCGEHQ